MTINADTKIAAILKVKPAALEAIIAIDNCFEKLRNPFLRKLMAGRTSIAMAAKMGGCQPADFFNRLEPLGFKIDGSATEKAKARQPLPAFLKNVLSHQITVLDVRPQIASGSDPLKIILEKIKTIQPGGILKIINSFTPEPLMDLLEQQGFESYADEVSTNLVETYFYKKTEAPLEEIQTIENTETWEAVLHRFGDRLTSIDVRHLEMPLPMTTILEAIDKLPGNTALFVYHKRIPVFLLPELAARNLSYRIQEISDGAVNLLIYKEKPATL